jgi:hypothetical protein
MAHLQPQLSLPEKEELEKCVVSIMQKVLPSYYEVDSEAAEGMTRCVQELASALSSEALNILAVEKGRKLNGYDMVNALMALGFDNYVDAIKEYLQKRQAHLSNCSSCCTFPHPNLGRNLQPHSLVDEIKQPRKYKKAKIQLGGSKDTIAVSSIQGICETNKSNVKKTEKLDWNNPAAVQEFVRLMTEAIQRGEDAEEVMRHLSKSMRVSIGQIREKFLQ